jgi:hypothetical protein
MSLSPGMPRPNRLFDTDAQGRPRNRMPLLVLLLLAAGQLRRYAAAQRVVAPAEVGGR